MPAFTIPRLKTPLPSCQSRHAANQHRIHSCNAWLFSSFRLPELRHSRAFASYPPLANRQNRNHYKTLDVAANVDKKELKKQFYRLSKRYHPDKNPGDADAHSKFVEINESYTILSDAAQRRAHDNELRAQTSSSPLGSPFASNSRGGFRRGGTTATRNTTRDPLRPDDWILYRRQASAKNNASSQTNPGYDYAKHQEEHYGAAAAEKRERNRQSRLFKTLYYQKLQEAQRFEGKMMAWVSIIGLGLFFVFHSGLIQLIWLDDEEVENGDALWTPGRVSTAGGNVASAEGEDGAVGRPP
ncbi:DNAj domain protein [Geranomyces variabilis]|nr:DNAj domain protein [Geranomyces variabilis]